MNAYFERIGREAADGRPIDLGSEVPSHGAINQLVALGISMQVKVDD